MFELLLEARELYLQDVILNGKRYDRYVDDFINSHRYINCNQNGYKYNSNQNVMEFMQEDCDYNISEIRSVLASMGFKQNDIGKSLSVLSGGEIIKLLLAKMLMGRYNILLMDEPSNFLDIPSLEALEILMKEYAGTIVFITHDKRLLENVADVVYEIRDKKINLKH